jgi:WD40 repeat protein
LDIPLRVLQAPSRDRTLEVEWTEFSPDGKLLITTHANGHVKVWNTRSWTVEGEFIVTNSHLSAAAFAPDGKTIMIGDANGVLHHWSLTTKAEIRTLHTFRGVGSLLNVAFSPDGKTLAATYLSTTSSAMIWNTTDWTVETESRYAAAAFSQDGKLLALGGPHIKLIEPDSRKQIRDIELPEMTWGEVSRDFEKEPNAKEKIGCVVFALAFSPDGHTLAAGCTEGTIRLVKIGSIKELESSRKTLPH